MLNRNHVAGCVSPIRVLVADDHPPVRELLVALLREDARIAIVAEARDGEEAVDLALQTRPDVIVMDVSMPRLNGLEATKRIAARLPETLVIGFSTHENAETAPLMLAAGASAYLTKGQSGDLIETILRLSDL